MQLLVNAVYCPGDSAKTIIDGKYQKAFSFIFDYMKNSYKQGDYFPMFMMGKTGQSWIRANSAMGDTLQPMLQWSNTNIKLRLLKNHTDTFFMHQLENDTSTTTAIELAFYFNK